VSYFDTVRSVPHPYGEHLKIYAHRRGVPVDNFEDAKNADGIQVISRTRDGRVLSTGKIGNDITHAHFNDKTKEMVGQPKYPRKSLLGQHDSDLESVVTMHQAHPDYHEPFDPNAFEAVSWGEFGGGAKSQEVKSPSGGVLRGTAKLAAAPVVTAQTGALKRPLGAGGAKPQLKPKVMTPAGAVHDAMSATTGVRRSQVSSVEPRGPSLSEAITAFREIEAIVEAQLGSDPVALKAAYRRQQERNTKIDQKYPGAREASRVDDRGRAPYHTYAYGPGAERPVGKLGRIALHPDHPSKAARAYEKGRARTTALYARRVAAQEK